MLQAKKKKQSHKAKCLDNAKKERNSYDETNILSIQINLNLEKSFFYCSCRIGIFHIQ